MGASVRPGRPFADIQSGFPDTAAHDSPPQLVDFGVHQDGLVHVSQLADRFVKDPSEVVRAGDRVKVRVESVDAGRGRIGLSVKTG